jgi:hypothetical protein
MSANLDAPPKMGFSESPYGCNIAGKSEVAMEKIVWLKKICEP